MFEVTTGTSLSVALLSSLTFFLAGSAIVSAGRLLETEKIALDDDPTATGWALLAVAGWIFTVLVGLSVLISLGVLGCLPSSRAMFPGWVAIEGLATGLGITAAVGTTAADAMWGEDAAT